MQILKNDIVTFQIKNATTDRSYSKSTIKLIKPFSKVSFQIIKALKKDLDLH